MTGFHFMNNGLQSLCYYYEFNLLRSTAMQIWYLKRPTVHSPREILLYYEKSMDDAHIPREFLNQNPLSIFGAYLTSLKLLLFQIYTTSLLPCQPQFVRVVHTELAPSLQHGNCRWPFRTNRRSHWNCISLHCNYRSCLASHPGPFLEYFPVFFSTRRLSPDHGSDVEMLSSNCDLEFSVYVGRSLYIRNFSVAKAMDHLSSSFLGSGIAI
jgi:hypothetical protein